VASLEASYFFGNLRRVYRNPRGLTSKLTKGVGCPTLRGTSPRYSMKLHKSTLGVFPCIELTTSEISLIRLQTRFIDFARLNKINIATCFVTYSITEKEELQDTWKLKDLCKKIKIGNCKDLLLSVNKEL
jgi:hypothetical protein